MGATKRTGAVKTVVAAWLTVLAAHGVVRADSVSGYAEWAITRFDQEREEPPGGPREYERFEFLAQRYNVNFEKTLFPSLQLLLGGLLERSDVASALGSETRDARALRARPYIRLRMITTFFRADVGYDRNEERSSSTGSEEVRQVRETYAASLGWFPHELPQVRMEAYRSNTFDGTRRVRNATQDLVQLYADYTPWRPLRLDYRGTYDGVKDRVEGSEVRTLANSLRGTLNLTFWKQRGTLTGDYGFSHRDTKILAAGDGELEFPVPNASGLSALDDTPADGPLDPNPALTDGDRSTGAGVNLGVPAAGQSRTLRNLGLSLPREPEINAIYVWVDRELPAAVAGAFAWQVWTSSDNRNWVPRQSIPSASFGPFLNRFEVRFNAVVARYVKLTVRPLGEEDVIGTGQSWSDVLVTELEPFLVRPVAGSSSRITSTTQSANVDLRLRLLEKVGFFYELAGIGGKTASEPASYYVSNGLSLAQPLGKIWSVSARLAREDGRQRGGSRVSYYYTASVAAAPLETFRCNVVFSGKDEALEGRKNELNGLYLYASAQLYRGIDVNVAVGRSVTSNELGRRNASNQINANATLVPHRALTFNLLFENRNDRISGGDLPAVRYELSRSAEASAGWTPLPSLYLYASYRVEQVPGLERRIIRNYSAGWSPFREGTLRVSFAYNETFRSEIDAKERVVGPSVRWYIAPRWYLDVAYQRLLSDSVLRYSLNDVVTASTRFAF